LLSAKTHSNLRQKGVFSEKHNKKDEVVDMRLIILGGLLLAFLTYGCAPVIVGGAATGAYKAGTDERTVGRMIDDSSITAKVNLALMDDPLASSFRIDVDTVDGNVILTGVVGSKVEVERAVELARSVEGVRKVTDNLQVGNKSLGQSFNDKVIGSKIKAKLFREPEIRSLNIDVDVHRGVVTLTGRIDNSVHKNRVIQLARTTKGTVKVVDNLTISSP
jgi:hyperosmotically inducible protein